MNHRLGRAAAASLAAVVLFASCGGDDGSAPADRGDVTTTERGESAATVPANGEIVDVAALDNTFKPGEIEIVAGTAVRWENRGRNDHNVLPTDDAQQWGAPTEAFAPGDDYTFVFDTPGTYPYYCSIHATKTAGMIGTVVVVAADG